jgi:hypothetical protein
VGLVAIGDKKACLSTVVYAHIESRQFAAGMLGRRPVYNARSFRVEELIVLNKLTEFKETWKCMPFRLIYF